MNIKCNHPSSLANFLFQQNQKSHTKFNLKNKIKFQHISAEPNPMTIIIGIGLCELGIGFISTHHYNNFGCEPFYIFVK